jgi:hypothetical protein
VAFDKLGDRAGNAATTEIENFVEQPWLDLRTPQDVELWIGHFNWDLQQYVNKKTAVGYGVCFTLTHGGEIYMHTTEGAVLLDVTPEAEWAAPAITAATGVVQPKSQIWTLPDDTLTQLVLGLNSLIASTRFVASHSYKGRGYTMGMG